MFSGGAANFEDVEPKAIGRPRASMVTIEVEVGLMSGEVHRRLESPSGTFQADCRVSKVMCLWNARIELYSSDYDNLHVV